MKFTAITQTKHEGDNSIMREGYTSQAKKALAYAVRTAEKCGHNYVGTEHLLIGLLNVEDGTDRKSTRLNSSHWNKSRMPSSA